MSAIVNPVNSDCLRVAESYSQADLQTQPSTKQVMAHFSDDCRFEQQNFPYNVGKAVARIGFKILCEWSVLDYRETIEQTLEEKGDHILWTFKSTQLRKAILPQWIQSPQWYQIDGQAQLFFSGFGEDTKICRYVTLVNDWQAIPSP